MPVEDLFIRGCGESPAMSDAATWYKDAIIYQVHVRSYFDSDGDGVGDFGGLIQRLDYIQDLGVSAVWLLPFYPSPLRDDGYDIADYLSIHPQYGNLDAFTAFLEAAHLRNLKVITELVLNHTSDQHPWFQRARRSPPGSPERDFYVWSDTPDKYAEARIIFKDFEPSNWSYDREAKAYYWHRFYSHQPDLNFDNHAVWEAVTPVVDFWFGLGVDGMRLDAVPYLYEREGTNCENLPETHGFLKALRKHIDAKFEGRMLLAEANQWPEDAVAYFGDADECHMAFHFPVMPRLFMGINREDRFPIVDIIEQTPAIPASCQWATFLRNHDELTLEMVTDEERDYMYRVYASETRARINFGIRRRLSPLMSNNRRRIELMNALLFSLPGTPVLYYGDEIGMGDNIYLGDRNGVRTPMQWSSDRNAGFSRANPQQLFLPVIIDPEYHYETVNVEAQQNNPHSLLWWMKRLIDIRRKLPALGRGTIEFFHPINRKVLAFVRRHNDDAVLVVANLSRFMQYVELSLENFEGQFPVEIFGGTRMPKITNAPYSLTLGPNSFYWLRLEPALPEQPEIAFSPQQLPSLRIRRSWRECLRDDRHELRFAIADYLARRLEYLPSDTTLRPISLDELGRMSIGETQVSLPVLQVDSSSNEVKSYVTPLCLAEGEKAEQLLQEQPESAVLRVLDGQAGVLYDASTTEAFGQRLVELIRQETRTSISSERWLVARRVGGAITDAPPESLTPIAVLKHEGRSTTLSVGQRFVLKVLREVAPGKHPAVEAGLFLAKQDASCPAVPMQGYVELQSPRSESMVLAVLYEYSSHEDTAWQLTLDALSDFYEQSVASAQPVAVSPSVESSEPLPPPEQQACERLIEQHLPWVTLLGQRVAEMHLALSSDPGDSDFSPEPSLPMHGRSLYQSLRGNAISLLEELRQRLYMLPEEQRERARELIDRREDILKLHRRILDERIDMGRIRTHGDLQLSRILFTGKDFVVIDFSGDPRAPLSERRIKRRPVRDLAALLHSLDYAAWVALTGLASGRGRSPGNIRDADRPRAAAWGREWLRRAQKALIEGYARRLSEAPRSWLFLPRTAPLLQAFLIDISLSDVIEELRIRPTWVGVALDCALDAVNTPIDIDQPSRATV